MLFHRYPSPYVLFLVNQRNICVLSQSACGCLSQIPACLYRYDDYFLIHLQGFIYANSRSIIISHNRHKIFLSHSVVYSPIN